MSKYAHPLLRRLSFPLKRDPAASLLLLALVFAACAPQAAALPTPEIGPILIGGDLCLTGQLAFADGAAIQGVQLALDDVNARGGVLGRPLQFTNLDCQGDPVIAGQATEKLIKQGARAIITPGDYYFGASSSRAAQAAGLVGISTTASSSLFGTASLGDKQFTISMWNNSMGAAAAEYAYHTRAWRVAYLVTDTCCDYTRSLSRYFIAQFTKLGGQVIEDSYLMGTQEFSAQLARIQALPARPDFFFFSSGGPELVTLIRTMHAAGIKIPVLGGDSYDNPLLAQALGPEEGNEIYFVTHTFISAGVTPGMAHFIAAYRAKYGQDPAGLVAPGWDVVMVLAQAMEKAGSTSGAAMAKAMEAGEFDLLTGKLRWSVGHQPDIEAALVRLDQGVPVFVGWVHPTDVPAP